MGLCLHVDCVLACSVASGSGFGLMAEAEEKIENSRFFSFVDEVILVCLVFGKSVFIHLKVEVEEAFI